MLISEEGVQYDSQILDEFSRLEMSESNNETYVRVIVDLKNISDADALISEFELNEITRSSNLGSSS
jgi:hypothetical protein